MAYNYAVRNYYRPTHLIKKAYGWSSAPAYRRADIPTSLMDSTATGPHLSVDQLRQQFAYEWLDSGESGIGLTNPPFVGGSAGRILPGLTKDGMPARILRGYIRRAHHTAGDAASQARLYFMFNPETITRDYVSYLEQGALDPFNTVYQSGNLVAPPSILDFSFDLIFDRQEEAAVASHPGVYVDYQFFDLVVRNVVPSDPSQTGNTLPDNGVMMVNPQDITVVFSPQFTVQGRPLNAKVTFHKFTHRMTPTRMTISLNMRAVYVGPAKDMTEYRAEEFRAEEAIPYGRDANSNIIVTLGDLMQQQREAAAGGSNDWTAQFMMSQQANGSLNAAALSWAKANVVQGQTRYLNDGGRGRYNLPTSADCSGLVVAAHKAVGSDTAAIFGHGGYPGTREMRRHWQGSNFQGVQLIRQGDLHAGNLQNGDLLIRTGHIVFFDSANGDQATIFDAASKRSNPQVGSRTVNLSRYRSEEDWYGIRPMGLGRDMSYNANNTSTSRNAADAGP